MTLYCQYNSCMNTTFPQYQKKKLELRIYSTYSRENIGKLPYDVFQSAQSSQGGKQYISAKDSYIVQSLVFLNNLT